MKRTICLIMAVLLVAATFCACGKGGNALLGQWSVTEEGVEMVMEFKEDGKGKLSAAGGLLSYDFEYSVDGNKLSLTFEGETSVSDYSIDGDKLTVTIDDESVTFTRK